jgi:hypothetical protein
MACDRLTKTKKGVQMLKSQASLDDQLEGEKDKNK